MESVIDGLRHLTVAVIELSRTQKEHGPAIERLEALELSRHKFEAMCEGLLLKAEGKLRAANNSEARERQLRKSYEHLFDPLAEDGEPPEAPAPDPIREDDATPSEADRLLGMRMVMASTNKTVAQRAKFGVR